MTASQLKIRYFGDPCLRKKCKPVKEVGPMERMLLSAMVETMKFHKGIGLAAPQVGITETMFVLDIGDGPVLVINPRVLKSSGSEVMEEGCLSIPDIRVNVKRSKTIWVEYTNQHNQTVSGEMTDLLAKVFLHEFDHLNGKLIVDYIPMAERVKVITQLNSQSIQAREKVHESGPSSTF